MKRKSDTYIKIYNQYRSDQDAKISSLENQVRQLTMMVEYLCSKTLGDSK